MSSVPTRDLDVLAVGGRFTTRGRTVTEADVASFAALTGDMHPQHTDAEWAAASPFGARVAHGMLVLSYALGLIGFGPERVIALRRVRDATFKRPVGLGDTIHARGLIDSIAPIDAATALSTVRCDVVNQNGRVVLRATLEVLCRCAESATTPGEPAESTLDMVCVPL